MLRADWYHQFRQQCDSEYIREAVGKHAGRSRGCSEIHDEPNGSRIRFLLEAYDLVITFDAILNRLLRAGTSILLTTRKNIGDRL